jgi:hypothetical protein
MDAVYRVIPLPVDLHATKIVQIHNITKKPAKMYVLSLQFLTPAKKKTAVSTSSLAPASDFGGGPKSLAGTIF